MMTKSPFRYLKTSPEIIQLAVMMYVQYPLSLRHVEDLLHGRCQRKIEYCIRGAVKGTQLEDESPLP